MTECTGKRYWRKRIDECVDRCREQYRLRLHNLSPRMSNRDLRRFTAWHDKRLYYLRKVRARWGKSAA